MRKHYLDNIRWITVVLVVIYHVIYMYNGVQPFGVIGPFQEVQYQDAFQYVVYPWFMALLFVVSGMSARYELETHTAGEVIRRRTRKLLVPSTIGLFVFQWILGYYNMAIGGGTETMFSAMPDTVPAAVRGAIFYLVMAASGIGVLWYIQMLWIFSILLIVVRKLEKDRLYGLCGRSGMTVLLCLTVLIVLSAQVLNTPVITVYRFGIYGTGFFIGYFILSHDKVMERLSRFWLPLAAAAAILGISYTVIYFGQNYAVTPVLNNIHACVYCWITILAILAVMKKWGDNTSPAAQWMAKKSWGLYIFHYLPLAAVAYYLHRYAPEFPAAGCYLLTGIAAFAGGYGLYELLSRIPVLRWCVLGIRKEKANV